MCFSFKVLEKEDQSHQGRSQHFEILQTIKLEDFVPAAGLMHSFFLPEQRWPDISRPGLGVFMTFSIAVNSICHRFWITYEQLRIWELRSSATTKDLEHDILMKKLYIP